MLSKFFCEKWEKQFSYNRYFRRRKVAEVEDSLFITTNLCSNFCDHKQKWDIFTLVFAKKKKVF